MCLHHQTRIQDYPKRYKARLVAKGFTQEYGVDYEETFASVLKHSALRIVFGLIASLDLETALLASVAVLSEPGLWTLKRCEKDHLILVRNT